MGRNKLPGSLRHAVVCTFTLKVLSTQALQKQKMASEMCMKKITEKLQLVESFWGFFSHIYIFNHLQWSYYGWVPYSNLLSSKIPICLEVDLGVPYVLLKVSSFWKPQQYIIPSQVKAYTSCMWQLGICQQQTFFLRKLKDHRMNSGPVLQLSK